MFCPSCGIEATNKSKYCKSCGANLNPAGNPVEVHVPPAPVGMMTVAIAFFSVIGFVASLMTLNELSEPSSQMGDGYVVGIFAACLIFVFGVAGILSWQLGRLISAYRDSLRRTIDEEKSVAALPPRPVFQQPLQVPAAQEPVASVTEHTTRSFSPSIEK